MIILKDDSGIVKDGFVRYLEDNIIQTRMLFSGNLIKYPCFDEMRESGDGYRVIGNLKNTDKIMNDTFWIGVYPGIDDNRSNYMVKVIKEYLRIIL